MITTTELAPIRPTPLPFHTYAAPDVAVRALRISDVAAFRSIRLEALRRDGRCFAADPAAEAARNQAEWMAACRETADQVVIGGFFGCRLVGIMAATVWVGDESGQTVQWGSAYVRPDYRRTGIGTWIYQARERWSIAAGFTAAMIPIRADNLRSTEIHLSQGAIYVAGDVRRFADGSHAMVRWYRREL